MRGKVKWFNDVKGYGFITPDGAVNGGKDVFVHFTGIRHLNGGSHSGRRSLVEGQSVEFDVAPGTKGPQAVDVAPV